MPNEHPSHQKGEDIIMVNVKTTYVTYSQLIEEGPSYLHYMDMSSGAGGAGIVTIHNSRSVTGEIVHKKTVPLSDSREFRPACPLFCEKGIYLVLNVNVTNVLIQTSKASKE